MTDAEGEHLSRSLVTDHVFVSRSGPGWDRCVCGLSMAAHARTEAPYEPPEDLIYRCPRCVQTGRMMCTHSPETVAGMLAGTINPVER